LGGLFTALAVLAVFLATIIPTNRLSLYTLSSFFISVIIIESGVKTGYAFYAASSILALIIIPDKTGILPYVFFFGIYGMVKYYIEKLDKIIIEYILKFAWFNLCILVSVMLIKNFLMDSIKINFPWYVLIILFEVIFLIYDYIYTLFIHYYRDKLKKMLRL
jgi:hypothetical protein